MERIRQAVDAQQKHIENEKREKKAEKKIKKAAKKEKKEKRKKRTRSASSSDSDSDDRHGSADDNRYIISNSSRANIRYQDDNLSKNDESWRMPSNNNRERNEDLPDKASRNRRNKSSCSKDRDSRNQSKDDKYYQSRNNSIDRKQNHDEVSRDNRSRSRDRDNRIHKREDKYEKSRNNGSNQYRNTNRGINRSRSRDRNNIRESRDNKYYQSRDATSDQYKNKNHNEVKIDKDDARSIHDRRDEGRCEQINNNENKKYGLQSKKDCSDNVDRRDKNHLGPNLRLLAKKAGDSRLEQAARNRPRENVKKLTDGERAERIKQMELDATSNDDHRLQRILAAISRNSDEKGEKPVDDEASFLKTMRTEVYITNDITMGERLQQNKHYNQKGSDLDSSGFMKKSQNKYQT